MDETRFGNAINEDENPCCAGYPPRSERVSSSASLISLVREINNRVVVGAHVRTRSGAHPRERDTD